MASAPAHPHPSMPHPPVAHGKTGLLLVNLGTPDAPDQQSVKTYLREFLSDRRVIEMSPFLWQPILRGIVLNIRPAKSAKAYAKIWDKQHNDSPLRLYTRAQAKGLRALLDKDAYKDIHIEWAMRYGTPSIAERLYDMQQAGCERIAVLALYPQYSATSSASVYDEVFRASLKLRWQPAIRTAPAWYDDEIYIQTIAARIRAQIETQGWQPDVILASFHGLPQRYVQKGDPYYCQCAKTTRLLREALGLSEDGLRLTFQSRFGFAKWLQPDTAVTARQLAREGKKSRKGGRRDNGGRLTIIAPGFVSDCLETLEEINIAIRDDFLNNGGAQFSYVPCLNDSAEGLDLLAHLARRNVAGWLDE